VRFDEGHEGGSYEIEIVFATSAGPAVLDVVLGDDPLHGDAKDPYHGWARHQLTKLDRQITALVDETTRTADVFGCLRPFVALHFRDLVGWYRARADRRLLNRILDSLSQRAETEPESREAYERLRVAAKERQPVLPLLDALMPRLGAEVARLVPAVDLLELTPASFITGWESD
jgi:hypothetical protein